MAHNATIKTTEIFLKAANNLNVEELLVSIYFYFDSSQKF